MTCYSRIHGSEDMDLADKLVVKKILNGMGFDVKLNAFAVESEAVGFSYFGYQITREQYDHLGVVELHRPDVLVEASPRYRAIWVVEIDGAVHRGGRKDRRRNAFYKRHNIPLFIINKADQAEIGQSWDGFLREKVAVLEEMRR